MKKSRTILFSILVFSLALAAALVILLFLRKPRSGQETPVSPGLYRKSEIAGLPYEQTPGARGTIGGAAVRINGLGFRGGELEAKKSPGTLRIVVLGDSVVFGQGVAEDETLPAQLAAALAKKVPGQKWELINAGVRGYNAAQYDPFLAHRLLPLQPDLVVLVITEINDPEREPFSPHSEQLERWKNSWWAKLPLAKPLLASAYSREVSRLFILHVREIYDPGGESWRPFLGELFRVREACAAQNAPLLAVTFPYLADDDPFAKERAQLQSALTNLGLLRLDPRPALRQYPAAQLVVSPSDFHPNALALQLTADLLADPIISELQARGTIAR